MVDMRKGVGRLCWLLVFSVMLFLGGQLALAGTQACIDTITVSTTADNGPGSLRQAVADVCPGGTIAIPFSTHSTFQLNSGPITITQALNIVGTESTKISLMGNGSTPLLVFQLPPGAAPSSLTGLTLRDGANTSDGGALWTSGPLTLTDVVFRYNVVSGTASGGAFYAYDTSTVLNDVKFISNNCEYRGGGMAVISGTTTLNRVRFSDNVAGQAGGGLFCEACAAEINNSDFLTNTTSGSGGGAMIVGGSHVTLNGSSFSENTSGASGGGLAIELSDFTAVQVHLTDNHGASGGGLSLSQAQGSLSESLVLRNSAGNGGGIYCDSVTGTMILQSAIISNSASTGGGGLYANAADLTVVNSTFSTNSAVSQGGGVYGASGMSFTNTTIAANTSPAGGGLYAGDGTITMTHSLFADNSPANCTASSIAGSYNLDDDDTCDLPDGQGNLKGTGAALSPLLFYNGSWLHPLPGTSAAVDAGSNALCPLVDQRGALRPQDGDNSFVPVCDIGAFELDSIWREKTFLPFAVHD